MTRRKFTFGAVAAAVVAAIKPAMGKAPPPTGTVATSSSGGSGRWRHTFYFNRNTDIEMPARVTQIDVLQSTEPPFSEFLPE